jgi:predicted DNA-binding transcriptional regulator AlpA
MNNTNKKYFRAKEVAEYLSIGLSTVWLFTSQGRLTAKKLSPRVTVFDIEEVERLLDGQMKSTEKNGSTQP